MSSPSKRNGYSFESRDTVSCVEFSAFEHSSSLIAFGGDLRVSIGTCRFQEQDNSLSGCEYQHIRDFHHRTRVMSIAWSPQASLDVLPRCIRFCTAGVDHKIRIFTSDLKDQDTVQVIKGHQDFINSLTFEPVKGEVIASVSDDHTCRLWGLDGRQKAMFPLKSAGMSVCWNQSDPNKLMVAEKGGTLRFYDLVSEQPFMSLETGRPGLMCADWSLCDPTRVGAIVSGEWMVWDITRSSQAQDSELAHGEWGKEFRWCRSSENLFATTGRPNNEAKVYHLGHHQVPVTESLPVLGGLSWHAFLPICAVGGDRRIHLFPAEP
ncbi:nucleoporin Nup37 [Strongylocentrotus purpuratus]|uniref:Nucleoporin Nup37 n=1 Tax=Strongylocentrotus purpuratus TaxID=7668 RepID=A0A7M7T072_STRPU|nr:nucleoporin Nup37 [Strongylocentrotus purpuratus]